ncbi:hypothetical protein [Pseudodesulfovibrio tunisiensis]|uniref:hypothetical protein n=1 Tax=Pseudodesulfovibrio tunisiensis TaxID=463192 RepID=UPI001FB30914|nr:hypothetical protein [Pseudodesulfovibrio tunisiensis]
MSESTFSFPEWLQEHVPDDSLFALAYGDIPAEKRALIKTSIARLYDWYGPCRHVGLEENRRFPAGFTASSRMEPVEFAVVLFDSSILSPARLLAGIVPAIAAGIRDVVAVRVGKGGPWRKAVLTGLELVGQEFVADLTELQTKRLFSELRDTGRPGAVTVLGPKAAAIKTVELQAASRISFWRPRYRRAATVWMDDENTFDLEALAFMHPDIIFSVFGTEVELPADNFSYEGNGFDDCLDSIMDVAYMPIARADVAQSRAKLTLCPGQEGCWVWPDLHLDHFLFHTTTWAIGD